MSAASESKIFEVWANNFKNFLSSGTNSCRIRSKPRGLIINFRKKVMKPSEVEEPVKKLNLWEETRAEKRII